MVPIELDFDNFDELKKDSDYLVLIITILRRFYMFKVIQYDRKNMFWT